MSYWFRQDGLWISLIDIIHCLDSNLIVVMTHCSVKLSQESQFNVNISYYMEEEFGIFYYCIFLRFLLVCERN